MSLLFGLAHAPGYVQRGGHLMEGIPGAPDPLTAAAYSIAVVSPIGSLFGVLWARTRSLPFVSARLDRHRAEPRSVRPHLARLADQSLQAPRGPGAAALAGRHTFRITACTMSARP